jgi:hypothetical protein
VVDAQHDQVVAMHDLSFVRRTELLGQLSGRPTQKWWQLARVKVHQSASHGVVVFVNKVDWVSGDE